MLVRPLFGRPDRGQYPTDLHFRVHQGLMPSEQRAIGPSAVRTLFTSAQRQPRLHRCARRSGHTLQPGTELLQLSRIYRGLM